MHILMLAGSMEPGGAETHIYELCRALKQEGHRITLAAHGGILMQRLVSDGVVTPLYLPCHRPRPLAIRKSRRALRRFCKQDTPTVLHAHTRLCAFLAKGLSCGSRRLPCVVTVHAAYPATGMRASMSYFGDVTLCVSRDLALRLEQDFSLPRHRLILTRNGIDSTHYAFRPAAAEEGKCIVCLCRMEADACGAVGALLDGIPSLLSLLPDLTVHVYGTGSFLPFYCKKAAILNKKRGKDIVIFHGAVADSVQVFSHADLAIVASRACLEAMACGCCVIGAGSFGFGGLVDARAPLHHAISSNFTFRGGVPCTAAALCQAIPAYFSLSSQEKESIRQANRHFIEEHYAVSQMATEALHAYRRSLAPSALLLGYYGFGNFGDEVSLRAIAACLDKEDWRVSAVTHRPRRMCASLGHRCIGRLSFSEVKACDALILGGGSILQDETSFLSLCYYLLWIALANRYGKKVLLYANGIGPLRRPLARRLVARTLSHARLLLRDKASLALCHSLGLRNGSFCADATELLPLRAQLCDLPPLLYGEASYARPFSLVAVRCGKAYRLSSDVSFLHPESGCLIFTSLQECDLPLCMELAQQYHGGVCRIETHAAMCALLAHPNLRSVFSQRYHLLYYARRMGVRAFALCDQPKIRSLGVSMAEGVTQKVGLFPQKVKKRRFFPHFAVKKSKKFD